MCNLLVASASWFQRTLEEIGDYVGHNSAYMTDRYRHVREGHEARAAERFDAFLAAPTGAETGAYRL